MILGAASGVAYDIFRIIRRIIKHPDFLTQIEDLIYWLFISIVIFYFILHRNNGEVRIYSIIGVFTGMCLYFLTLSRLIIKVSVFIINIIEKIVITAVHMLLIPIKLIIKLLSYPVKAIKKWLEREFGIGRKFIRHTQRSAGIRVSNFKKEMYIIRKKI